MRRFLAAAVIFVFSQVSVFAQYQNNAFKPEIKRVAVFKNGYTFTYREGEARTENGWAYTTNIPTGVIGAIWGYTKTPNARVVQLLASRITKPPKEIIERTADYAEFLRVNEGAKVRIEGYGGKTFEGVYKIISSNNDSAKIALRTERGTMILDTYKIDTIEIIGDAKFEKKVISAGETEDRLAIKTDGAKDGENINLGIAALERGIRWIPAYRIEVKGEPVKEAKIELEAMLINELTDLNNSEVYFVVGVPHFLFQDTVSPLSLNQTFAGVSSYFQRGAGGANFASNAIMTQQMRSSENLAETADTSSPTVSEEEQTASFSAEQLYLYQANQISLKKDERTSLRLFSLTVPCSEVFEWTLADAPQTATAYLNSTSYASSIPQPSVLDLSDKIWYSLRLKNTTGMPWTTAPALSFRDWKPLGQDMLSFTQTGGENILHVTPATEVIGSQTLKEISRVHQQLPYNGSTYDFDLVTIEGTIKIRNAKKQPVELSLTRNLVGAVSEATDDGKISRNGLNLQSVNPNSIIKWNLTLPSGEKEIRYTYRVYVRK